MDFIANVILTVQIPRKAYELPYQTLEKALTEALERYCALPVERIYIDTLYPAIEGDDE